MILQDGFKKMWSVVSVGPVAAVQRLAGEGEGEQTCVRALLQEVDRRRHARNHAQGANSRPQRSSPAVPVRLIHFPVKDQVTTTRPRIAAGFLGGGALN